MRILLFLELECLRAYVSTLHIVKSYLGWIWYYNSTSQGVYILGTPWSLLPQTEPKSHVSKYYSSTTIFLIIATKVFVNLPITFNIKLPYLARGNGGVVYLPTVRLNLLYIECLQIHVSPSRKPVIFHGPCGNDTLALDFPLERPQN